MRRIGVVDQIEIVVALHALLHRAAEALAPVVIAQQRGDRGRRLLGRGDIGQNAAVAQRRMLVAPAGEDFPARTDVRGDRRDRGGARLQHAQRLRFTQARQHVHMDARKVVGDVDLAGEAHGVGESELARSPPCRPRSIQAARRSVRAPGRSDRETSRAQDLDRLQIGHDVLDRDDASDQAPRSAGPSALASGRRLSA